MFPTGSTGSRNAVRLLGWFTREDLLTQGKIENQGYLDNYVMYDRQLRRWNRWPGAAARYFPL